jgi:lipoyl(octanoyl) transferase
MLADVTGELVFAHAGFGAAAVPYLEGWELQRRLHELRVADEIPDTCLLLEHQPVYTAGKRTDPSDRPAGDPGAPVIDVDRGGKITWHGPGQLVGYPIIKLAEPIDVIAYVRALEQALIRMCADFGVRADQVDGRSGAWVRGTALPGAPAAPGRGAPGPAAPGPAAPAPSRPGGRGDPRPGAPRPDGPGAPGPAAPAGSRPGGPDGPAVSFPAGTPGAMAPDRKVAAIGARVSRGVTMHGFALNCDCDLSWFDKIVPCGIRDAGVTSLSAETARQVTVTAVLASAERALAGALGARQWRRATAADALAGAATLTG